jgi:hypothetical protein
MDERRDDGALAIGEREAVTVLGLGAIGTAVARALLARGHGADDLSSFVGLVAGSGRTPAAVED